MPVDLVVPLYGSVELPDLASRTEEVLRGLLGIQQSFDIQFADYAEGATHRLSCVELRPEEDRCVEARLVSTDAVSHFFVFQSMSLDGPAFSVTPGRTPLGRALGAALAAACAQSQRTIVIDHAHHFTGHTHLSPVEFIQALRHEKRFEDLQEAAESFQSRLRTFLEGGEEAPD